MLNISLLLLLPPLLHCVCVFFFLEPTVGPTGRTLWPTTWFSNIRVDFVGRTGVIRFARHNDAAISRARLDFRKKKKSQRCCSKGRFHSRKDHRQLVKSPVLDILLDGESLERTHPGRKDAGFAAWMRPKRALHWRDSQSWSKRTKDTRRSRDWMSSKTSIHICVCKQRIC